MKSILVIGKNGQVGSELLNALSPLGNITATGRAEMDLTKPNVIREIIRAIKPDVIVNAAAYTAVDKAESEPDLAMSINGTAPGVIAEEALRINALLIHYSTDYVFDGTKPTPYVESDAPNPLNVYGRTKLAGELAIQSSGARHYTLRTSWVYAAIGSNFVNTILRLAKEREELRIVDDQVGAPTSAHAIAEVTAQLLLKDQKNGHDGTEPMYGLYHLTAKGAVTWFGFAQAIINRAKVVDSTMHAPRLIPITTAEYPLPARRPANSVLDSSRLTKAFGIVPSTWQEMLEVTMQVSQPI